VRDRRFAIDGVAWGREILYLDSTHTLIDGLTQAYATRRYRSAWMEQHVGSEFDGVVSGVTSFGLFVELNDSKVNGLVHVTQLPHDYYHFDPLRKSLKGERKGLGWRLGDPVRVMVMRASVEDRRIDFKLVLPEPTKKKKAWAE